MSLAQATCIFYQSSILLSVFANMHHSVRVTPMGFDLHIAIQLPWLYISSKNILAQFSGMHAYHQIHCRNILVHIVTYKCVYMNMNIFFTFGHCYPYIYIYISFQKYCFNIFHLHISNKRRSGLDIVLSYLLDKRIPVSYKLCSTKIPEYVSQKQIQCRQKLEMHRMTPN